MPRPKIKDTEQDKLARFERIKKVITTLEKQQRLFLKQGELAPSSAWVARYQVRQNTRNIGIISYNCLKRTFNARHHQN